MRMAPYIAQSNVSDKRRGRLSNRSNTFVIHVDEYEIVRVFEVFGIASLSVQCFAAFDDKL
jgi:hypothetical protein